MRRTSAEKLEAYLEFNEKINVLWENQIKEEYIEGRITTERSLQAQLYRIICEDCSELKLDIFIEPFFDYKKQGLTVYRPDIVICCRNEIIFVGEIKFAPHWYPAIGGDIEKIKSFARFEGHEHQLAIDPKDGRFDEQLHEITSATKYGIFVIGRADSKAVKKSLIDLTEIDGTEINGLANRFKLFCGKIDPENDSINFIVE